MRTFKLFREIDPTGLAGTGIIAEGVEFTNKKVIMCWLTEPSTIVYHENIESVEKINCSHSKSKIIFD